MTEKNTTLPADRQYENDAGETRRWRQIAYYGWKEGADIEQTDDGILVDGELYRPVDGLTTYVLRRQIRRFSDHSCSQSL